MKRLLCFLCVFVFLPVLSFADSYTPVLGMSIDTFIQKYNSIGASLTSSLLGLSSPKGWMKSGDYNAACFAADSKANVYILLQTLDNKDAKGTASGLDSVQIVAYSSADFMSLITVAEKCTRIFSPSLLGTSWSPKYITDLIIYYYENINDNYSYAYNVIDSDNNFILYFFGSDNGYIFELTGSKE